MIGPDKKLYINIVYQLTSKHVAQVANYLYEECQREFIGSTAPPIFKRGFILIMPCVIA